MHPTHSRPVMYQRWDHLLFLHWRYNAADIAARLPEQLSVDLYQGQAYISIIGFCMNQVRPRGLPALPWLSYFYELNVRVYVRDPRGTAGVYFFSLDCNRAPAVWIARATFGLPYQRAHMTFNRCDNSAHQGQPDHRLTCRRMHHEHDAVYDWIVPTEYSPAEPGSLEFFLTERYNFFTIQSGVLKRGEVSHSPYQIGTPTVRSWSELPLVWDALPVTGRAPDLVAYSPGVAIEAFALQRS